MKTPIRVLIEGLLAGAAGAVVQSLFFEATRKLAPAPSRDAFAPPEPEQLHENQLETTARRLVEGLAQRGPLDAREKQRLGNAVHVGFGAAWGGLYGLLRASFPSLATLQGTALYASFVWLAGDELMLPALKLSAWPQKYPLRTHAYAAVAHLAFGAGLLAATALIDRAGTLTTLGGALVFGPSRRRKAATRALVPAQLVDRSRRIAKAVARRARDLAR